MQSRGVGTPDIFLMPVSTLDMIAERSGVDLRFESITCLTDLLSLK